MANIDLTKYGITGSTVIAHNPSYEELYKAEINPASRATRRVRRLSSVQLT